MFLTTPRLDSVPGVMSHTSLSLLERLQQPDAEAWQQLVALYTPLISGWLRRQEVPHADAEDLTQEVLTVVVREVPQFRHNQRPGAFRTWLRTITIHRLRDYWRSRRLRPTTGDAAFEQLEDPHSAPSRLWDQEHDRHVARRLMELIEPEFEPSTWRAFRRTVLDGVRAAVVAPELGLSVNAILIAKSRVLQRLRSEAQGLTD
jgi:RNA polymerase sigma factor (sigma-70 family)